MQQNHLKLMIAGALLSATAWLGASSSAAFEKKTGGDVADKNCERKETNGGSTFGKCGSVCKDKEVTFSAELNKYVCSATRVRSTDDTRPPVGQGGKPGKTTRN